MKLRDDSKVIGLWYDTKANHYYNLWNIKEGEIRKKFEISHFNALIGIIDKRNRILDLGCGDCRYYFNSSGVSLKNYFGIDVSRNLLQIAKHQEKSINIAECNAYSLSFKPESFDVIVSIGLFEFIKDPVPLLEEGFKILKPGGKFIFNAHNKLAHSAKIFLKKLLNIKDPFPVQKAYYIPNPSKLLYNGIKVEISHYYSAPIAFILKVFCNRIDKMPNSLKALERIDTALNKVPLINSFATTNVYCLHKE